MTEEDLRHAIVEEIGNIAPEADASAIADHADLRDALDLDSMDIFNLVVALSQRFAIDIPDAEAARFTTLGGGSDCLRELLANPPARSSLS